MREHRPQFYHPPSPPCTAPAPAPLCPAAPPPPAPAAPRIAAPQQPPRTAGGEGGSAGKVSTCGRVALRRSAPRMAARATSIAMLAPRLRRHLLPAASAAHLPPAPGALQPPPPAPHRIGRVAGRHGMSGSTSGVESYKGPCPLARTRHDGECLGKGPPSLPPTRLCQLSGLPPGLRRRHVLDALALRHLGLRGRRQEGQGNARFGWQPASRLPRRLRMRPQQHGTVAEGLRAAAVLPLVLPSPSPWC